MHDKQFDEFFRDKINDYRSPVADDMWDKVKPSAHRRRRILFWIWPIAATLLLSAGGYFIFKENISNIPVSQRTEPKTGIEEKNRGASDAKGKQSIDSIGLVDSATKYITNQPGELRHSNKGYNYYAPETKSTKRELADEHLAGSRNAHSNEDTDVTDNAPGDSATVSNNAVGDPIVPVSDSIDINKDSVQNSVARNKSDTSKQTDGRWFTEIGAGPAIGFRTVEKKWLYPLLANGNTTSDISFSSAIYIGRSLDKNFTIKTGLIFTSVNEKASHDSLAVETINNRFYSLDVPFILGYSIGDKKLKVNFNAGVVVNVRSWYTGKISDSLMIYDITSSGYYKNWTGIKGYAGVSALYKISQRTYLYAEPYFIYQFSEMSARPSFFSQRIHTGGILAGLRYMIPSRQHK